MGKTKLMKTSILLDLMELAWRIQAMLQIAITSSLHYQQRHYHGQHCARPYRPATRAVDDTTSHSVRIPLLPLRFETFSRQNCIGEKSANPRNTRSNGCEIARESILLHTHCCQCDIGRPRRRRNTAVRVIKWWKKEKKGSDKMNILIKPVVLIKQIVQWTGLLQRIVRFQAKRDY